MADQYSNVGRSLGELARIRARNMGSAIAPIASGVRDSWNTQAGNFGDALGAIGSGAGGFAEGLSGAEAPAVQPSADASWRAATADNPLTGRPSVAPIALPPVASPPKPTSPTSAATPEAAARRLGLVSEDTGGILRRGAFQGSPEWGGDVKALTPGGMTYGKPLRSGAQMEQDIRAHNLIDVGNEQAMASIDRAAARQPDAMDEMQKAQQRMTGYERSLPPGSTSHISASRGGTPYTGEFDDNNGKPFGGPTGGEVASIEQAAARAQIAAQQKFMSDPDKVRRDDADQRRAASLEAFKAEMGPHLAKMTPPEQQEAFRKFMTDQAIEEAYRTGDFSAISALQKQKAADDALIGVPAGGP